MNRSIRAVLASALFLFTQAAIGEQSESVVPANARPVELILAMSYEASREQSYTGVASWSNGVTSENIRVFHRVSEGYESERIVHLDGALREVIRAQTSVDCIQPGQALRRARFSRSLNADSGQYEARIIGEDRVANRPVWQVQLVPHDEFRYGQFISIDKSSGLVLRALVVNADGEVLESFQFLDIELREIAEEEVSPNSSRPFEFDESASICVEGRLADYNEVDWAVTDLPEGFELLSATFDESIQRTWLMYGDGFNAFSVFIEPGANGRGLQSVGSISILMQPIIVENDPFTVTVMGDIPLETIDRSVTALRRRVSE